MPTTYYVSEDGSDSNSGLSSLLAFKTMEKLQTVIASGDTAIVLPGVIQPIDNAGDLFSVTGLSNVTIRSSSGNAMFSPSGDDDAWISLFRLVASGGFSAGTGASYVATIATGLTLVGVNHLWFSRTKADGRHYGWLVSESLANVQAGPGTQGRYNYNSGTGVLAVSLLGGTVPAGNVGYGVGGRNAIEFNGGSNNRVVGIKFAGVPSSTQSQGVELAGCSGCELIDCDIHDPGSHGLTDESRATATTATGIARCRVFNGDVGGFAFTTHAESSDIGDGTYDNITAIGGRILGEDGEVLAGLTDNLQVSVYTHTSTSGEVLAGGIRVRSSTLTETEPARALVSGDNCDAVADPDNIDQYPIRISDSRLTSYGRWYVQESAASIAVERSFINNTTGMALGFGSGAGLWHVNGSAKFLFRYCVIYVDSSHPSAAGTNYGILCGQAVNDLITCYNCTIVDICTSEHLRTMHQWGDANTTRFKGTGNIYAFGCTSDRQYNRLCWNDPTANASRHTFSGNVYVNLGSDNLSQNASYDTRAEWTASIDTAAVYVDSALAAVLPNIASGLADLTPASSLWNLRRPLWTPTGERGINGQLDSGHYGAYQYGLAGGGRVPRQGPDKRAPRG